MSEERLRAAIRLAKKMDREENVDQREMDKRVKDFLDPISGVESSFGKNTKHRTMRSGIHKNTAAIGELGLMPNTIDETAKRIMNDAGSVKRKDMAAILKMKPDEKKAFLKANPEKYGEIARYLGQRALERQDMDEEKAAYSWFQGTNLTPEQIEKRGYKDHDYVKKFRKMKKLVEDNKVKVEKKK